MIRIFRYKRLQIILAWYDIWIGVYYDIGHRTIYVCPLPMVVLRYELFGTKNELLHRKDREHAKLS
jgi:hypothetical protein